MSVNQFAKAVYGGITAGVAALGVALSDGNVTPVEWTVVIGAVLAAGAVVFAVPNAEAEVYSPEPEAPSDVVTE